MLTVDQAVAYVIKMETSWNVEPSQTYFATQRNCDGITIVSVATDNNSWDVWTLPNGDIYGEC